MVLYCNYCGGGHTSKSSLYKHINLTHKSQRRIRYRHLPLPTPFTWIPEIPKEPVVKKNPIEPEVKEKYQHPDVEDVVAEEGSVCVVCLTNKPIIISVRCGHLSLCCGCSKNLILRGNAKCPTCRGEWADLIRVYV